jgi:hypothetical protein
VLRHRLQRAAAKLLDAIRSGTGGGIEIACPAVKRDSDRFDFAAGEFQTARKKIAPVALRALVGAFSDDLTELAAACQQLISDVPGDITEQIVERYYGGRVETSAFTVADTAIAGRYGDARGSSPRPRQRRRSGAARCRDRLEAANDGARRRHPRVVRVARGSTRHEGLAGRSRAP